MRPLDDEIVVVARAPRSRARAMGVGATPIATPIARWTARHGTARHRTARHGTARHGTDG
jgi:hypothetical protein